MFLKIAMLIIFFAIMIAIGFWCRKNSTDVNGFVLGGRSVGPWVSAFAYGTSYFSAVIFVGYAGQFGWKFGIASTWIGIGNALLGSLAAWVILGRRTRIMTQHLNSATMPQFFEARYGSSALKIAASVITFIFLIPYTASLYNGLSRLFEMAFHIDYSICVIVMAVLTGIYVIAGGYMATAINDFVQGIIMLFGIVAVVLAVLNSQGGFLASLDGLARISDETVTTTPGIFASFFGPDPLGLLGVILLTSLGTWGLPQMVQKFYAIKSEKSISTGTIVSTFFAIVVAGGCYFLGGFGRLFSDKIDIASGGFDSIIPTMLSSPVVIAIIQYKSNVTFIAQLMGVSWGALAGAFLAPFLYGLYFKGATKASVWVSFVFSSVVMILNMLVRSSFPKLLQSPINAGAFCMIAGLILVPLVSLFTKKPDPKVVEEAFECYNEKVLVPQKEALGDGEN